MSVKCLREDAPTEEPQPDIVTQKWFKLGHTNNLGGYPTPVCHVLWCCEKLSNTNITFLVSTNHAYFCFATVTLSHLLPQPDLVIKKYQKTCTLSEVTHPA